MRTTRLLLLTIVALVACRSGTPGPSARNDTPTTTANATDQFDLIIAATTDVHGRLRGWDYYQNAPDPLRSLASAATIVDSLRTVNPGRVVLVDGGDLLQGNPLTFVAARVTRQPIHPVVAAMNAMQYDAAAIGNHEFNYGVPHLDSAISKSTFPFLAANVRRADNTLKYTPFTIVQRNGVSIGIVGGTTPGSMIWDRDNMRAAGLTVGDIIPAVRAGVEEVKRRGAHVVIVVLHSGLDGGSSYDTTVTKLPAENVAGRVPTEIPGVDAVVFGHSHRELADSIVNGVLLVQPRNWAATVGIGVLTVERQGNNWRVVAKKGQSVRIAGHVESPRVLAATDAAHRATVTWATAPIGRAVTTMRSDSARVADVPIVDFMLEVMRREANADLAATAAFSLDATFNTSSITVADVSRLYPYDNTLRAIRISGAQLRAFIEHSARYYRSLAANGDAPSGGLIHPDVPGYNFDIVAGANYTIDLTKPVGSRVTRLEVNGRAVAPTDSFTMAVNNYRQGGGGGFAMLANAPVVFDKELDIRQLLIDEVRRVGTINPAQYSTRNWELVPRRAVEIAYAELNRTRAAEATGAKGASPADSGIVAAADQTSGPPNVPAGSRVLRVVTLSDFHAALETRVEGNARRGGAVALSASINKARSECATNCTSIVIDAGDLFSGTPASDWDAGKPTVAVMNRLGIVAGALGNHEFDFGQDTLRMRLRELSYPVLAANVRGTDGKLPAWLRSDTIIVRDGIRIGIVGAAAEHTPSSTKARNVRGLTFLPPAPVINERTRALRAAGAQVVIATIHDGGRCNRTQGVQCSGSGMDAVLQLTERPDLVVLGHAHTNENLRINGIPVVQVTSSGRAIGVADIVVPQTSNTRTGIRTVSGDSTRGADVKVDSIVRASVAKVEARMNRRVASVAENLVRRGDQYPLGNLMADFMRVMGNAEIGAWNNGGIRANLDAGDVTIGDLHAVVPFGNSLARLRLRGSELKKLVETWVRSGRPNTHVSGLTIRFDASAPVNNRVVSMTTADGRPVDPTRIYTMVINDFMLDEPELREAVTLVSEEVLAIRDIDAIAEYLRRQPQPVRAPADVRITAGTPR